MVGVIYLGFVAAVILCATTVPAAAAFGLLAGAVASLLAATPLVGPLAGLGISIATAANVLTGALIIGGALLVGALTRPRIDPGDFKNTFEEQEVPEINAIGRVELGGLKIFGNTNEEFRYRLIGHSTGVLDGIENYYLGGREVVLDDDGLVLSKPYKISDSASYVHINSKVGDGTETAFGALITKFPSLWTSSHRNRGIFQSLVRYESPGFSSDTFLQLYQNGTPDLRVRARLRKPYDPRTETNVWTDNGIVCALDIILACYPNLTIADFDEDFIADEADLADVAVDTLTGTEPRSRCSGVWTSEQPRGDVVAEVLRSIGAMIVPRPGGLIGIQLIDDARTAEETLPVKHLLDMQWKSGPDSAERPNICRLKYYSPEHNYELTEINLDGIAWARIDDEVTRVGPQYYDVDLSFCISASQAQRIARRLFSLARADTGIASYNMVGLAAWETRVLGLVFPDSIGTLTVANGAPRVLDDQGKAEIPFAVWPTLTAWDPDVDEAPTPTVLPEIVSNVVAKPFTPTEATIVTYPDASKETRVAVAIDDPTFTGEAVYRGYNAEGNQGPWRHLVFVDPNVFVAGPGVGETIAYIAEDLTGDVIDFRIRQYQGDQSSAWSEIFQETIAVDNTAPDAPVLVETIGGTVTFAATAPASLNVAYLSFSGPGAPGNTPVRPRQVVNFDSGVSSGTWTVTAHASDGTASAPDTVVV